jgi:sedoheptulose-bisphosphatase
LISFYFSSGETEWTINGRYTGKSEIPLTAAGEAQVLSTGRIVVGPGKLIDPAKVSRVFVSPRTRALRTYDLLFGSHEAELAATNKTVVTEQITEWDYGAYEGLLTKEIRERRKQKSLDTDRAWDIWKDGCEDGE